MKNTNIISTVVLALAFLVGTINMAKAQPTCAELGYDKTTTQCGSNKVIKCPTDTSKAFCVEKCPSVSISKYEICTKKCADDANVCIEKRDMTCNEYITANNGEKIIDGATISGTKTRNLYLMGAATAGTGYNPLKLTQISVNDASEIPACKAEGAKPASLDANSITIEGYVYFNVKTRIGNVYKNYSPSTTNYWSARFSRDADITVYMTTNPTFINDLRLDFEGNYGSSPINAQVNITCEDSSDNSSWYKSKCNVDIGAYNANVNYCGQTLNAEINWGCSNIEENGICKQDCSSW